MAQLIAIPGIDEVRKHSTWFLVMGIALILVGTIAIGSSVLATIASMIFLGWLLVIGGIFEIVHGFARRLWGGFFVNLLGGVLYAVAGFIILDRPGLAAVTLTLLIAMILLAAGTFRLVVAFSTPMRHRGWLVINGALSIVLGLCILASWPSSGLWVIGLFVGIDMIFDGWTEVMLAMAVRGGVPAAA